MLDLATPEAHFSCVHKIPFSYFLSLETKSPTEHKHQLLENTPLPVLKLEALRFRESLRLSPKPRRKACLCGHVDRHPLALVSVASQMFPETLRRRFLERFIS